MTAYFFPSVTWERLVPLARMTLFSLYQHDIYEQVRPDHARQLRKRTIAVVLPHPRTKPALAIVKASRSWHEIWCSVIRDNLTASVLR